MDDSTKSTIRRAFLPFAAKCLASLISSNGEITSDVSSFEMDGLTRFAVTEDTEPLRFYYDPNSVEIGAKMTINQFYTALWAESVTPNKYLTCLDKGLSHRIVQGRGALLNRLDAQYERLQLRCYMNKSSKSIVPQTSLLGEMVLEKVKSYLDGLMFQLNYEDGGADGEDEMGPAMTGINKSLAIPQLTGCLSLILTVLLSKPIDKMSNAIANIFGDSFGPAFDLLVENVPYLKSHPADLLVVFNHLSGIVRVLTFIAAFGGGGATIPRVFGNQAKSLFTMCKSLLQEHRNQSFTSGTFNQTATSMQHDFDSDSEDGNLSRTQTHISQTYFSDDSDGLMDDDEDDEKKVYHPGNRTTLLSNGAELAVEGQE